MEKKGLDFNLKCKLEKRNKRVCMCVSVFLIGHMLHKLNVVTGISDNYWSADVTIIHPTIHPSRMDVQVTGSSQGPHTNETNNYLCSHTWKQFRVTVELNM